MRVLFMLLFQFRACSFLWRLNLKTQTFDLKWSLHLIFRRGSVHSTKMAYNRSWQNSRLNCCLELERIFYSVSLNEKLVSNMNKFLFQNGICSVIIACTIWTLKSLKESKGEVLKAFYLLFFNRNWAFFFWTFAFHFVDFNIAFFNLQAERELTNF